MLCSAFCHGTSSDFSFGVSEFDGVWERLIDYVFGIADKERYFPQSSWHILRNGKFSTYPNSHLYPDTIMLYDGKTYILDAKNYKFGLTAFVDHLPATDSVQKQITYGNYVVTKGLADSDHLYNAFLLPYCKDESDELPYKFVSVATADWIAYTADTEKYKYILAILVDTRHLIATYARLNASECFTLAGLIEKSVDQFLNQYFHAGDE